MNCEMINERQQDLIRRLIDEHKNPDSELPRQYSHISVDRYLNRDVFELEKKALFQSLPIIAAHSSEISQSGDYLCEEINEVPLVLIRDQNGKLGVFINACRHRGAKLLSNKQGNCKHRLVCPYHSWTYSSSGDLIGVPEKHSFGDLDFSTLDLVPVQFAEEFGFVWVCLDGDSSQALDIKTTLGKTLSQDFDDFALDKHQSHMQARTVVDCNWKLVMDAFAEGYHVGSLHKDSLSRFFLSTNIHDECYPHVRQLGARKTLLEEVKKTPEHWNFRQNTTLFYNVFPNTVLVFHPYWISQMSLFPMGINQVEVVHRMLIEGQVDNKDIAEKLNTSFQHIQGQVFEQEDFAIASSIQKTLASRANDSFPIGGKEQGLRIVHKAIDQFMNQYQNK